MSATPQRSCGTCAFRAETTVTDNNGVQQIGQMQLQCHRRPPAAFGMPQPGGMALASSFPPVQPDLFCYDYWPEGVPLPGAEPESGVQSDA